MLDRIIQKLHDYKDHPFLDQFKDVRAAGLLIFLTVALLISWSGVRVIQTNYELQKRISELRQQNAVQELANDNLRLTNKYLESDEYLELAARQNFGLGQPGEKLVLVSNEAALKNTIVPPEEKRATPRSEQPAYQRNFQGWMNFFLNRQS